MQKTAAEKQAQELSERARAASYECLEKLASAEDPGDGLILVTAAAAYSNLAVLHKLDQIETLLQSR